MDVGALIFQARWEAGLTQHELAERAGVSRFAISHYEAGRRLPTLGVLRAVLAAAGKQLHAELEPLDADVRAAMARIAAQPMEDRQAVQHWHWLRGQAGQHYRVEGLAAAELLGAPVEVDHLDLALADLPATYVALVRPPGRSWARISVRRDTWPFSYPALWPEASGSEAAAAGERLRELLFDQCPDGVFWMSCAGKRARVRLAPPAEVERYVEVVVPQGTYLPQTVIRVAPLLEIESTDPRASRVLRVVREDAAAAARPS